MANKLFLNNKDLDAPYEPSESEDELSEEEKQILKEVRQGRKKKTDSKQEILAFDESADDDDDEDDNDIIGDSDIERGDEDDGIPDSKAWGKQRRSYYNTDFVDQDYSAYNEQEEEEARQEEEEASAIQMRLAKQLDEADFFLDLPVGKTVDTDDEQDIQTKSKSKSTEERTKLKSDLSNLSKRQRQQLFEKDSPEFAGLVNDFLTHLAESETLLTPIIEFATERNLKFPLCDFVTTRDNMIMTYCTNVAFYLLLKSKRISIKNHPVTKRLVQFKKLITQLQQRYENVVKPQLEKILEKINSGEELNLEVAKVEKEKSKGRLRILKEFDEEARESDEDDNEEPTTKRQRLSDEEGSSADEEVDEEDIEGGEDDEAERRGITYQIAKNKGLMPHRKKESRNPRVKHRGKFRKALIRRKGAVRTVRKEIQRYGGEVSGIKATTKKGIKIKS